MWEMISLQLHQPKALSIWIVILLKATRGSTGIEMVRSGHRTHPGPGDWRQMCKKGQGLRGENTPDKVAKGQSTGFRLGLAGKEVRQEGADKSN